MVLHHRPHGPEGRHRRCSPLFSQSVPEVAKANIDLSKTYTNSMWIRRIRSSGLSRLHLSRVHPKSVYPISALFMAEVDKSDFG